MKTRFDLDVVCNRIAHFLGMACVTAGLSACAPEDNRSVTGFPSDISMIFSASAEDWGYGADGSVWQGGETFLVRLDGEEKRYVISDAVSGELSADGTEPFFWKDNKDVTIDAWYPYNEGGLPEVVVKSDQSSMDAYRASDYLAAMQTPVSISLSTSPLEFSHRVANVVIRLEIDAELNPEDVLVTLMNVKGLDSGTDVKPYRRDNVFMAMVPPQNMQDVEFISVDAGAYSLTYAPDSFKEGYLRADRQYTWTFAIEKDSIKLIGTEGNPEWESDGEEEIEAEPVI